MKEDNLNAHVLAVQNILNIAQEQGISPGELLGHVLQASKHNPLSVFCIDLRRATAVCLSETIKGLLPKYVSLYDALVSGGVTERASIEVGADSYIYYLPEQTYGLSPRRKALREALKESLKQPESSPEQEAKRHKTTVRPFVLTTQSANYLIVLSLQYGEWSLHIRQFWADLDECLKSGSLVMLEAYRNRKDLTLKDVVSLAHTASEEYSDAYPRNSFVSRPSLKYILSSTLEVRNNEPSRALESGDATDAGYVVSYSSRSGVDANGPEWYGTLNVKNVVDRLAVAMQRFDL